MLYYHASLQPRRCRLSVPLRRQAENSAATGGGSQHSSFALYRGNTTTPRAVKGDMTRVAVRHTTVVLLWLHRPLAILFLHAAGLLCCSSLNQSSEHCSSECSRLDEGAEQCGHAGKRSSACATLLLWLWRWLALLVRAAWQRLPCSPGSIERRLQLAHKLLLRWQYRCCLGLFRRLISMLVLFRGEHRLRLPQPVDAFLCLQNCLGGLTFCINVLWCVIWNTLLRGKFRLGLLKLWGAVCITRDNLLGLCDVLPLNSNIGLFIRMVVLLTLENLLLPEVLCKKIRDCLVRLCQESVLLGLAAAVAVGCWSSSVSAGDPNPFLLRWQSGGSLILFAGFLAVLVPLIGENCLCRPQHFDTLFS